MANDDFNYVDYITSDQDHVSELWSRLDELSHPSLPVLRFGVVVEVLNDPGAIPADRRNILYKECENRVYLESAPKNSILVRDVTSGLDRAVSAGEKGQSLQVAYPIFPPHIALPLKAGETVFLIDATPQDPSDLMYWLCRIPAPDYADGINFTHWDRTLMEIPGKIADDIKPPTPEFLNGMGTQTSWTLANLNDYDMIFSGSFSNKSVNFETVPRFTKRPGDLVFQGSNNALICLGEDRGFGNLLGTKPNKKSTDPGAEEAPRGGVAGVGVSNANLLASDGTIPCGNTAMAPTITLEEAGAEGEDTIAKFEPGVYRESGRGTIDIVTGRGQIDGTKPFVVVNSRGWEETNKNPVNWGEDYTPEGTDPPPEDEGKMMGVLNNWYANPQEGDPDFTSDMSRVYVSMKTTGDDNFLLEYPEFAGVSAGEHPYVIFKSDEIRVVARETGSVRLIKEGTVADNQCVITMLDDGTIAIDAKKIIIGDGRVDQIQLGNEATERIVLGDVLKTWIKDELLKELALHTHTCPAGTSGPPDQEPIFSVTISDKLDEPADILSAIAFVGGVEGTTGQIQAAASEE